MNMKNKLGVIVDSFRVGVREGLQKAKQLGADGVQIYAVEGEMAPDNLTPVLRREWKAYIDSLGLEVSALVGELGQHGFQDKRENAKKIEMSKRILDLALEMGTNIVTTHIGVIPDDVSGETYATMHEACRELSEYAAGMNAHFAIETGPETAAHLKQFLDTFGTTGIAVNYDPANLVMVTGDDPVQGVYTLKDYIVHTHAKDGVKLYDLDPRIIYRSVDYDEVVRALNIDVAQLGELYKEVPLGEGNVDWDGYMKAVQKIGYSGYLTVERETGDDPAADIAKALKFLRQYKG